MYCLFLWFIYISYTINMAPTYQNSKRNAKPYILTFIVNTIIRNNNTSIHPQLSEKGTSKHQVELDLVNFIQDLLYESEGKWLFLSSL